MVHHISSIDIKDYTFGSLQILRVNDSQLDNNLDRLEYEHTNIVIHDMRVSTNPDGSLRYSIIWSTISPKGQAKHKTVDDITNELTALGQRLESTADPVEIKTIKEESLNILKEIVHRLNLLDEIKGRDMQ